MHENKYYTVTGIFVAFGHCDRLVDLLGWKLSIISMIHMKDIIIMRNRILDIQNQEKNRAIAMQVIMIFRRCTGMNMMKNRKKSGRSPLFKVKLKLNAVDIYQCNYILENAMVFR